MRISGCPSQWQIHKILHLNAIWRVPLCKDLLTVQGVSRHRSFESHKTIWWTKSCAPILFSCIYLKNIERERENDEILWEHLDMMYLSSLLEVIYHQLHQVHTHGPCHPPVEMIRFCWPNYSSPFKGHEGILFLEITPCSDAGKKMTKIVAFFCAAYMTIL